MHEFNPRFMATKLLVLGIVLIVVRLYTEWDIWVVFGVIVIIKAILMFIMPLGRYQVKPKKK